MAWQVAVVLDQGESVEMLHANLSILLGQMPVWVIAATERVPGAGELRKEWDSCWHPEPGLTLVTPGDGTNRVADVLNLIPSIQDHHPRMCGMTLFGVLLSEQIESHLASLGLYPTSNTARDGLGFTKRIAEMEDIPLLELNAAEWRSENDVYDAFFKAVGAPEWHGRNFDALIDSIETGAINELEVPYKVIVRNVSALSKEVTIFLKALADFISEMNARGCPVEMRIES